MASRSGTYGIFIALSLLLGSAATLARGDDPDWTGAAQRLYQRIAGTPLRPGDPLLTQMAGLLAAGKAQDAALLATGAETFFSVTLKALSAPLGDQLESPYAPLDDFQALVIGTARDDRDARELLTADAAYVPTRATPSTGDNRVYQQFEAARRSYRTDLTRREPQWPAPFQDAAGLLTTRGWAEAHFSGGTNRRALERTFREFLCAPIDVWKEPGMPDWHVRRDVDRAPSGDGSTFQTFCRTCHAMMDGLAGAYARFDFRDGKLLYAGPSAVMPKYNQNATVFPDGFVTVDDSWTNMTAIDENGMFGWRGATSGNGAHALGTMVANAAAFSQCLTKRAFQQVCAAAPEGGDAATITQVAARFEQGGYKLKSLYADVAASSGCLGLAAAPAAPKTVALKDFRQLFESWVAVTGLTGNESAVETAYANVKGQLPKTGAVTEMTSPMLLAATTLGNAFCGAMIDRDAALPPAERVTDQAVDFTAPPAALGAAARAAVVQDYAATFWQRAATGDEVNAQLATLHDVEATLPATPAATRQLLRVGCAAMAASVDALVR